MSDQDFGSIPSGNVPPTPAGEQTWQAPPPPPPGYAQQPPPGYAPPSASGLSDNAAGAIAYLTIIPAIIFLLIDPYKQRAFVRFHAVQCLVLAAASIIIGIVLHSVGLILSSFFLAMGLNSLCQLIIFVFWLLSLIQASQGKLYKIPVLGDIAANLAKA